MSRFLNQSDLNVTCPVGMSLNLDETVYEALMMPSHRSRMNMTLDGLNMQDPCRMTDDEREELQRRKRKEDAYKTALCESFRRTQTCSYGMECRFAHGLDELRLPAQPRGRSHPKYKTVLCEKFTNTGYCRYGARCQFIHKITNPVLMQNREAAWKAISHDRSFIKGELPVSPFIKPGHFDMNTSMPYLPYGRHNSSRDEDLIQFDSKWAN